MKVAILNTSILTADGNYELKTITTEEAVKIASENEIDSAVGHISTALILTEILGIEVPMNRQMFAQETGQKALVFKLHGRSEEGKILSRTEIEKIGYSFKLLTIARPVGLKEIRELKMERKFSLKKEALHKGVVIHCPEEWMGSAFCGAAYRFGLEWCNFNSYKKETFWKVYKDKTCYEPRDGTYSEIDYYRENNYKIIPFWDAVDLGFKSRLKSMFNFIYNRINKKIRLIRIKCKI